MKPLILAQQCTHPETGDVGSWLYMGESYRIQGTARTPLFSDTAELFHWLKLNGYRQIGSGVYEKEVKP